MYREANRASFLGRPGSSCLSKSYGKLVALELLLKDHLGAPNTSSLQHDVPAMLTQLASTRAAAEPPISAAVLNSKATQLANKLGQLNCANKNGDRVPVPPKNYPYMRYIFHEFDGVNALDVREQQLIDIGLAVDDILTHLQSMYGVN